MNVRASADSNYLLPNSNYKIHLKNDYIMKKILTIAVSIAAIFAIASCGSDKKSNGDKRVSKAVELYETATADFYAAGGDTEKEEAIYDELMKQFEEIFKEDYETYKAEYDKYLEARAIAIAEGDRDFEWDMTTIEWIYDAKINEAYQKWDEAFSKHKNYFYMSPATLGNAYERVMNQK